MTQKYHSLVFPQRIRNRYSVKNWYTNIHISTVHDRHKVEIIQAYISRWIGKQSVMYPYKEILFNHEKEWCTDTYYNMN